MSRLFGKGNNYFRQLGVGNRTREKDWREVKLGSSESIKRIECYGAISACVTTGGDVYHWGYHFDSFAMTKVMNFYKTWPILMTLIQRTKFMVRPLNFGNFYSTPMRVTRVKGANYVDFRLGSGYLILRDSKGQLYGMGDNRHGQCGVNVDIVNYCIEPTPIRFREDSDVFVSQVDSGLQFSIVLTSRLGLKKRRDSCSASVEGTGDNT